MSCVIIIKCCKSVKEKMSKFQLKSNKFRIKYAFVTRTMRHKINVSNAEDDNDVEAICSKVFFALQFFSFALFRRVRAFLINKNCKKEEKSGRNVNSLLQKLGEYMSVNAHQNFHCKTHLTNRTTCVCMCLLLFDRSIE